MKFLLFSLPGCYPCERAKKELRNHFSDIPCDTLHTRSSELAEDYLIKTSPTLVILDDEDNCIGKLVGAHNITKIEIQGLISDFFNC